MKTKNDKNCSIFMEAVKSNEEGTSDTYVYSMRRVCAFCLYILSIILGIVATIAPIILSYKNGTNVDFNPIAILTAIGVPAGIGTIILFFTTWQDLSELAKNIKK